MMLQALHDYSPQGSFLDHYPTIKAVVQGSRRYSIVGTEVSLFVLDSAFFAAKLAVVPSLVGRVSLTLLSTVGVASLHYTTDRAYKSIEDMLVAWDLKNYPVAILSAIKITQLASNTGLTLVSFGGAVAGLAGYQERQALIYHRAIGWGIGTLGVGLGLLFVDLYVTYRTRRDLIDGQLNTACDAARVRYCMDKDTLWHLLEQFAKNSRVEMENVIKKNLTTQLKVTLGIYLFLIVIGYILQAIEKYYTPNSLQSAAINWGVSLAYALYISFEKTQEFWQRQQLDDQIPVEDELVDLEAGHTERFEDV